MEIDDISRKTSEGLEVDIMVSPRSDRSGPEGIDEWRRRLIVKVRAPPLDGKANKEVERIIKEVTGHPSEVIFGHTNRHKTVLIRGDPVLIAERLRVSDER